VAVQREAEEKARRLEQERLQREAEKAKHHENQSYTYTTSEGKIREITLGITYIAGNPARDRLSERVADNHAEYAARWGLQQEIETNNLLVDECIDLNESSRGWFGKDSYRAVDCVPYWNKVAVLKRWLDTPQPRGVEAWFIILDDDMPITNMSIDPYEAIDLLRDGDSQSIIIAEDIIAWNGSKPSPNTGLIMVRHDAFSKKFIDQLWETRLTEVESGPDFCRTLGVCHKQYRLHEQQGFADVMETYSNPSRKISLIPARSQNPASPRYAIALNTFHRSGCFYRDEGVWQSDGLQYHDPQWGKWRKGDWMGQTAGVPMWGWWCGDRWHKTAGPIRADMIDQMLDAVQR